MAAHNRDRRLLSRRIRHGPNDPVYILWSAGLDPSAFMPAVRRLQRSTPLSTADAAFAIIGLHRVFTPHVLGGHLMTPDEAEKLVAAMASM